MRQHCIDKGNIKDHITEQPRHWHKVIPHGFHDYMGFAVQTFEQPCQLVQFTGVSKGDILSKGPHDYTYALTLGNINANAVHPTSPM